MTNRGPIHDLLPGYRFLVVFYYFGSKERLSAKYPSPTRRTIIEPFAGSAGYARLHWEHNVILVEKDDRVVELWERLRRMTPEQALSIPPPVVGERSSDLLVMLRRQRTFADRRIPHGHRTDGVTLAEPAPPHRSQHPESAALADHPRRLHRRADIDATWFIDPPYEMMKRGYRESGLDYPALGSWCRERTGQVIVCEQEGRLATVCSSRRDDDDEQHSQDRSRLVRRRSCHNRPLSARPGIRWNCPCEASRWVGRGEGGAPR